MSTNFAHAMTAFPVSNHGAMVTTGMTMRDYFAAKAMQGMMANPNLIAKGAFNEGNFEMAYQAADAMLRAREVQHD